MPKVSIVLPTYNVERYFRECLDSLIGQTLEDIEIIPVDDGSPDNCGVIMDEYAARDARVKPIHQPNGGYGSAVNLGFAAATGEYVAIVEPDDWCEPDMYEKLYTQAKRFNADVCKAGFTVYNSYREEGRRDGEWHTPNVRIGNLPNDRAFKVAEVPIFVQLHASIWSNIYRRQFLVDNGIEVNGTAGASYQDLPFMVEVACRAERIAVIHDLLYHWRVEPDQQSSTNARGAKLMLMAYQSGEATRIAKENGLFEALKDDLCVQYYAANIAFFTKILRKHKEEYREMLKKIFEPFYGDQSYVNPYLTPLQLSFIKDYLLADRKLCKWSWVSFRRKLFRLHLNRHNIKILLFGIVFYDSSKRKK